MILASDYHFISYELRQCILCLVGVSSIIINARFRISIDCFDTFAMRLIRSKIRLVIKGVGFIPKSLRVSWTLGQINFISLLSRYYLNLSIHLFNL